MNKNIKIRVTKQGTQFLGECLEFPVMTHGRTLEELSENMEKALLMFLAEDDTEVDNSELVISTQVELK